MRMTWEFLYLCKMLRREVNQKYVGIVVVTRLNTAQVLVSKNLNKSPCSLLYNVGDDTVLDPLHGIGS